MPPTRIAVLNTHPIQYFAPLYAFLHSQIDLDITAFYLSDFSIRGGHDTGFGENVQWDLDLLSGYTSTFVGERAKERMPGEGFWSIVAPELWSYVRKGGFDVLWLHGHGYAANNVALAAARSVGIPVLMRSETHLQLPRSRLKSLARRSMIGALYSQCDRFLAIGSANAEFYRAMGVNPEHIFLVPYVVDNDRFMQQAMLSSQAREAVRASLGVDDERPIVLYASKLQRRKHPDDLVHASGLLAAQGIEFHLVIVGSGEMESELRSLVMELALPRVHFTGFKNQTELPRIYAASDIFVLPAEAEPWGLVVNEAMCAGLPIVTGDRVGSARDLVKPGENGALFTAGDVDGLARALHPILVDPAARMAMARRSREIISGWGFPQCLSGLRAAISSLSLSQKT